MFRDFLDWKGVVLIEPTALTHNPDDLSDYEKNEKREWKRTRKCSGSWGWRKSKSA